MNDIDEQRARDALAFEPLPSANWLRCSAENGLEITVKYSERLSCLLRSLPGAKWDPISKKWRLPFSCAAHLRDRFEEVDELAHAAKARSDEETAAREAEKQSRALALDQERKKRNEEWLAIRPRPIKSEFLATSGGQMFALQLEAIGDDAKDFGMSPRNWVGQIIGISANGRWARAYLNGARDYSCANKTGSRGIIVTYLLERGLIYEVAQPITWSTTNRYFCRVDGQELVKMTENEVRACLVN